MASQAIVGAVGIVVVRVRGGDQAGEVRVVVQGLPHYYLAYSAAAVDPGHHVVVINNRGAGRVDVEPLAMADPPSFDIASDPLTVQPPVERT